MCETLSHSKGFNSVTTPFTLITSLWITISSLCFTRTMPMVRENAAGKYATHVATYSHISICSARVLGKCTRRTCWYCVKRYCIELNSVPLASVNWITLLMVLLTKLNHEIHSSRPLHSQLNLCTVPEKQCGWKGYLLTDHESTILTISFNLFWVWATSRLF